MDPRLDDNTPLAAWCTDLEAAVVATIEVRG
jgi:hypothetical protein